MENSKLMLARDPSLASMRIETDNGDADAALRRASCPIVRVMRVGNHDLPMPRYETDGAAGADLRADLFSEGVELPFAATMMHGPDGTRLRMYPGARVLVPCGFAFAIPDGYVGLVCGRSSMTKRGIMVPHNDPDPNGELRPVGVIDPDYRGVVSTYLWNMGNDVVEIEHGQRVSQMLLLSAPQGRFEESTELPVTARSTGGFGSTGTQ